MHIFLLFAMGGLLGLVSSALHIGRAPRRPQIDVAIGIMGALLGGLLCARSVAGENVSTGDYGISALAMTTVAAVVPLAVLNLVRKTM